MQAYEENIAGFYNKEDVEEILGTVRNNRVYFKNLEYIPRGVKRISAEVGFQKLLEQGQLATFTDSCVYIHIPFCRLHCTYCGFFKQSFDEEQIELYVKALLAELDFLAENSLVTNKLIKAVFFGGGTPSVLNSRQIQVILDKLHKVFTLDDACELTFESSIYDMNEDKFGACVNGGINRFSFGIQTFNTDLRRSFGRPDPEQKLVENLSLYARSGKKIIIDLIYGLPGQSYDDIAKDIELAKEAGIAGLDLYKLQLLPNSVLAKQIALGTKQVNNDVYKLEDWFLLASRALADKGAEQISCCHWAFRKDEKSLYNTYVKQGIDNVAVGAACGGKSGLYKYMKIRDLSSYKEISSKNKPSYMVFSCYPKEYTYLNALMGQVDQGKIDFMALSAIHNLPLENLLKPILTRWEELNLVVNNPESHQCTFTSRGAFWYRDLSKVLLMFLEYALWGPVTKDNI